MLVLVHSGQTGVERGAQRAASTRGITIAGFCTSDRRDELGKLPPPIACDLTPCYDRGPRPALEANVAIASCVLLVVPDASRLRIYAGMEALARWARALDVPLLVIDPDTDLDTVVRFVEALPETSGSTRVFVTGPRGTRWTEGERLGWQLVAQLDGGSQRDAIAV